MKTICICGGGSLGHVIAGYISAKGKATVNILTRNPDKWSNHISVRTPEGKVLTGCINKISDNPADVIPESNIILLCLPGFAIASELELIKDYVKPSTYVGSVFSSTGFFFEAMKTLPESVYLWGFQRVPFVARTDEYGQSAFLLGYKPSLAIAVERSDGREGFATTVSDLFDTPVTLLNNYLEASITNSNPLLHTSRLYTMFKDWEPGVYYPKQYLFYEEWTDEASQLLAQMDIELFELIKELPVDPKFLEPILKHYDSKTPHQMTEKIKSIPSFKGLKAPMVETPNGWIPDFSNRYFVEDFEYGLKYIKNLTDKSSISTPNIDKVYSWYKSINS